MVKVLTVPATLMDVIITTCYCVCGMFSEGLEKVRGGLVVDGEGGVEVCEGCRGEFSRARWDAELRSLLAEEYVLLVKTPIVGILGTSQ